MALRIDEPNISLPDGTTTIDLAAEGGHTEIIDYIAELNGILSRMSSCTIAHYNYRRFTIGNPPNFNSPNFSDWCWNLMYIFVGGLWPKYNEELVIHCLKKLSGITDLENQISFEPLSYNQIMKLGPEILFFFSHEPSAWWYFPIQNS